MKLDFGTEVNGYIIDSAFTVSFDPQFSPLLQATRDATLTGVRESGIDVRLGELGGLIEEVLNSYEVTIYGKTYPSGLLGLWGRSQTDPQPIGPQHRERQHSRGQVYSARRR